MLFHGKNGYANDPHCYAMLVLLVLSFNETGPPGFNVCDQKECKEAVFIIMRGTGLTGTEWD